MDLLSQGLNISIITKALYSTCITTELVYYKLITGVVGMNFLDSV